MASFPPTAVAAPGVGSDAAAGACGPSEPMHRRRYVAAFDGLRAVLVVAVLAYHLWGPHLRSAIGQVAVVAFFSLSGFLITFLLADEYRARGTVRLGAFFRRRAVRLVPALGGLLVVWSIFALVFGHQAWITSVPGGGPGIPLSPLTVFESAGAALGYVTNWLDAFPGAHLWSGYSPLGQLWSLAVEEQFYLVWAPVMLLLMRLRRPGRWISLLALGLLFEPLLVYHQGGNRLYFGTDTRMSALLVGAALGWYWRSGSLQRLERSVATPVLGFASALALVVAGIGFEHQDVAWQWVGGFVLASLAGGGLVLYLANRPEDSAVSQWLTRPAPRWVGQRSYAIYLWGYVFNTWFRSLGAACAVLTIACTLAAAEISHRLLEQPARAWDARRRRAEAPPRAPAVPAPPAGAESGVAPSAGVHPGMAGAGAALARAAAEAAG